MIWKMILKRINLWVAAGAAAIVLFLFLFWAGIFVLLNPTDNARTNPTAVFMIIQAPTLTPTSLPSPTVNIQATQQALEASGQIHVGGYVQISGTAGDGLRLRAGPGLTYSQLFLGYDDEVFAVKDGPNEADGYEWWYLVAPYDEDRSGWAAANYLTVVSEHPE